MIQQPPTLFPEATNTVRGRFYIVAGIISVVMAVASIAIFWWIYYTVNPAETPAPANPTFVNYDSTGDYLQADSLAAMNAYITANPQPKAVQVLTGMSTAEIAAYMVGQVSGGLKVDCTYCHNIADFSLEEGYPNAVKKITARAMLLMSADLNQNYVSLLPASVGGYNITCATCHNGQAVGWASYPTEIMNTLPDDWTLPLYLNFPGGLQVTGNKELSNTELQRNQYTMYHFNVSLGQGCTFCHNARYFPAFEIAQKNHASVMLLMAKHIQEKYVAPGGKIADGIMAGKPVSCWQCHRGARVPPGAANPGQVPTMLSSKP